MSGIHFFWNVTELQSACFGLCDQADFDSMN